MTCKYCGKENDKPGFCQYCGKKLDENSEEKVAVTVKKSKKSKKITISIISIVLVIALVAGGIFGYKFIKNNDEDDNDVTASDYDDQNDNGSNKGDGNQNGNNSDEQGEQQYLNVNSITVQMRDVQTNISQPVLVSVEVQNNEKFSELSIVNKNNVQLGVVKDNGMDEDVKANDGIYTGNVVLYSEVAEPSRIYASCDNKISKCYETIYFYPEYQSQFYNEYSNLEQDIDSAFYQNTNIETAHNSILELLESKKKDKKIEDYSFEQGSITVQLLCGSVFIYSYDLDGAYKDTPDSDEDATEETEDESPEYEGLYTVSPQINKVVTLQPYRNELGVGGVDSAAEDLADSQYNLIFNGNLDNTNVNIEAMKTLNNYNVILLDGHGGYSRSLHSFFGIGTKITDDLNERYWSDLYYDRIIQLSGGQYGVTSKFFDYYYDHNDFGNTIIYLGCCHGADDSVLAETLISKGVDAVYAYKNSVSVGYDTNMVKTVFEELAKTSERPTTVKQALQAAKSIHGDTDDSNAHWYNWLFGNYENKANRACLYLIGDESFTLKMDDSYLRGKVADSKTKTNINNALITATPVNGGIAISERTDKDGNFAIPLLEGYYNVIVESIGYLPCEISNIRLEYNSTTYLENTILLEQIEGDSVSFVEGTITDAVTGNQVSGATIRFRRNYNNINGAYVLGSDSEIFEISSNEYGTYSTDYLEYGYYTAEVSREGYATIYVNIVASPDTETYRNQNVVIAPEAQGNEFRITLEWDANPRDEDAHIVGDLPTDFHVYYVNKSAYYDGEVIANLDHDDTQGNGFETVTLKAHPEGTYKYYVYHYAGTGSLATSNAIVKVYQGGVLVKQYNVPVDQGTGRYWNVFNIVNGKIVSLNRISDSSSQ